MSKTVSKEIMGASSVPMILAILKEGDSYGYEIMQKIYELSENKITWKEGSLYPVLKRLEQQGLIESYWNTEGTRARKYFKLLEPGPAALEKELDDWRLMISIISKLCKTQLGSI